jgi:hypothetical protein
MGLRQNPRLEKGRGRRGTFARAGRAVLLGLALAGAGLGGGCAKAVCDGETGGCLALHVEGTGSYDRLEGVLLTSPTGTVLKAGDAAGMVTLPVAVQILPPPGVATTKAGAIRVNGYRGTVIASSGLVTLSWPDGARVEVKLSLIDAAPSDLAIAVGDMAPGN